jgi:hypothetical protein
MTISKFRTLEAAEKDLWCLRPDYKYYHKLRELFMLAYRLNPVMLPHGVFKYKTLEQAEREKDSWLRQWVLNKSKGQRDKETKKRH